MHLRPAGDAGFDAVAEHVVGDFVFELVNKGRSLGTRADQRHLALEHIPQLRQLVDRPLAQESTDGGAAGITADRPHRAGGRFGVHPHRAELPDHERFAVEPHTLLAVENRATIIEPDDQCEDRQEGQEDHHADGRQRQIDRPFGEAAPALERHLREVDHRHAVEVFEARLQGGELEHVRHQLHFHTVTANLFEHGHHAFVRFERQRDVDLIDVFPGDHRFDVLERAEHGGVLVVATDFARIVVEVTHHLETQLAVRLQLVGDFAAEVAGTHDQDALQVEAAQTAALLHPADDHPGGHHQHQIAESEEADEGATVGEEDVVFKRPVPGVQRGQQEGAEKHCQHDGQRFVDPAAVAAALVKAVEVEDDRPGQEDDRQDLQVAVEIGQTLGEGQDLQLEAEEPGEEVRGQGGGQVAREVEESVAPSLFSNHRFTVFAMSVLSREPESASRFGRPVSSRRRAGAPERGRFVARSFRSRSIPLVESVSKY